MALEAQNNPFTSILMVEAADPEALSGDADPSAGQRRLVVGTDHILYLLSDSGVKTAVGGAGIANPLATDSLWDAAGDLVQGTGANTSAKLSAGTAGKVLTSNGAAAALTWETPAGGGAVATDAIWDAAGDLVQGTGANTGAKLTAGTAGYVLTSAGAAAANVWANPYRPKFIVSAGSSKSATAFADTDLVFPVEASSVYVFEMHLYFFTNATTVAIRLAINGPSGATGRFGSWITTSPSQNAITLATAQGTPLDTAIGAPTSGPGASPVCAIVTGSMTISGTPGNITLRHASETATQTDIEAGSWGWCAKVI